jgi:cytochrome c-type biogenesis protein CcmH/NrfF
MKRALLLFSLVLAAPVTAQGIGSDAPFANRQLSDPALEAKARTLMGALRCIQCQGQSIADSDAPIAGAMRSEVRQRIAAGESPGAVRDWLIGRYGEWVSFEPQAHGMGLLLWLLPFLLLLGGIWAARGLFAGKPE